MSIERQHIIVFRLSAMGDVAMTVPVLRLLVNQYPNLAVTVVSRGFFEPFFDMPNVHFVAFDAKGRHKGFLGLIRLYKDLHKLRPTAFADLHNVLRSKIIATMFNLSGVKTAAFDKDRARKKLLTRASDKVFEPLDPVFEKHAKVFLKLGFPIDLSVPKFPVKKELSPEVLAVTGVKTMMWIGIAPFAQHNSKVYPTDLMQRVIDELAQLPVAIFLFGSGADETQKLESFASDNTNVISMAGKLSLSQELQLISNLDLMISMDSANAHLAAMYGVDVITLWGATHPYSGFLPYNQDSANALVSDREQYPQLPTSIYGNKKVAGYEDAMRTITPESVVVRVKKYLKFKSIYTSS